MAPSLHSPEKVVIRLSQANFIDIVRKAGRNSCQFKVELIDDSDVIQVTVKAAPKESETQVGFNLIENFPKNTSEQNELAVEVFKELGYRNCVQIAFFIDEEDQIFAYRRHTSTDSPTPTKVLVYPSKDVLYSRNKGILESGLLEKKKVAIIGLGSGGSHIAVELAKAGVGKFLLIDFDRIELSNIIRHTCGITDLGRFKTKAIRDCILDKNPFAVVYTYEVDINDLYKVAKIDGLKSCDLIIAATDSKRSRRNINDLAFELKKTTIFGKCLARAAGGDVAVVRPGKGPCFNCICGNDYDDEVSNFRQARDDNPAYVSDSDVEVTIQVGLSSDIQPISNMMVKIALVELCKESGTASPLSSLEEDFKHAYFVWANRKEANYFEYDDKYGLDYEESTTILRWYAVGKTTSRKGCSICNESNSDEEEELSDDEK